MIITSNVTKPEIEEQMIQNNNLRVVVVPSDPISDYERAGYDWLERYYNPQGFFQEVFALSPREQGERYAYGMTIMGVPKSNFTKTLRKIRPSVVRAYGGYWPSDLVCRHRIYDTPVIVSVHNTTNIHRSVRYADIVICMSGAVREGVLKIGTGPDRIRILPNRIDLRVFKPIRDKNAFAAVAKDYPQGKHILHVGRKTEQKNLDTVIKALTYLPSDYLCVFVGLGEPSSYKDMASQMGVGDRCFWVDSVRNSELPIWYSWCDCMCTPSRWEGFGIVFIEAAACGSGIVTSDIAPMNEYLRHDHSAFLVVDYENPQAIASAIEKVCENRPYRRVISEGAIKAARPFDLIHVDAAEVEIYKEAITLPPMSLKRKLEIEGWKLRDTLAAIYDSIRDKRKKAGRQPVS